MSGILAQGARFHLLGMPRNYALTLHHDLHPDFLQQADVVFQDCADLAVKSKCFKRRRSAISSTN